MMEEFDPNGLGIPNGNYFGLPFTAEESELVLLSVPWDVTTSYRPGTSNGPDAILDASLQCDLYDCHYPGGWERGIGTLPIDERILYENARLREEAERIIHYLEEGRSPQEESIQKRLVKVNEGSEKLNNYVDAESRSWLKQGKLVGLVGGDHSVPLGLMRALAERHGTIGILHLDAHADLRKAYEGFEYSHASIMYNALHKFEGVTKLVQVGIRDLCDAEVEFCAHDSRIVRFDDYALKTALFEGVTWHEQCDRILAQLPLNVYVSFDIDALSPDHCPHTGTPVPGGLTFHEAIYLLHRLVESGRRIVGFDLTEVSVGQHDLGVPVLDDYDANVGARLLYKLCNFTLKSNQ